MMLMMSVVITNIIIIRFTAIFIIMAITMELRTRMMIMMMAMMTMKMTMNLMQAMYGGMPGGGHNHPHVGNTSDSGVSDGNDVLPSLL